MTRHLSRLVVVITVLAVSLAGGVAAAEGGQAPVRLPFEPGGSTYSNTVTVRPGDHLWKISAHHLDELRGRSPEDEEISLYWRAVIAVNLPGLRSGDPDVIYPGETVVLPPVSG